MIVKGGSYNSITQTSCDLDPVHSHHTRPLGTFGNQFRAELQVLGLRDTTLNFSPGL